MRPLPGSISRILSGRLRSPRRSPNRTVALPALSLAFDVVLVEYDHPRVNAFAILKDIAGRRLRIPVILVVEWDEKAGDPCLQAGGRGLRGQGGGFLSRAVLQARSRACGVGAPEERAELNLEEVPGRERLERQLRDALATASDTQRSFNTAAEHFRQTQARLQATIDEERASREALEAQAGRGGGVASGRATARGGDDPCCHGPRRATRARRGRARGVGCGPFRARTESCRARRRARTSRQSTCARGNGRRRAARHGERRVQGRAAHAIRSRDDLAQQLRELTAALEEVPARTRNESAAAAEHSRRREAELAAAAADAAAARTSLEQQAREAAVALQQAEERAAVERAALAHEAANTQEEFETSSPSTPRAAHSRAGPGEAETARQHAEQWAASELAAADALSPTVELSMTSRWPAPTALARRSNSSSWNATERSNRPRNGDDRKLRLRRPAGRASCGIHGQPRGGRTLARRARATVERGRRCARRGPAESRRADGCRRGGHLARREAELGCHDWPTPCRPRRARTEARARGRCAPEGRGTRRGRTRRGCASPATRQAEFEERLAREAESAAFSSRAWRGRDRAAGCRTAACVGLWHGRVARCRWSSAVPTPRWHVPPRFARRSTRSSWSSKQRSSTRRRAASGSRRGVSRTASRTARRSSRPALGDVTRARDVLALRLSVAAAALEASQQDRASEAAAAADRQAQLGAALSEAAAARSTLERKLADVEAAHQHASSASRPNWPPRPSARWRWSSSSPRSRTAPTLEQNLAHAQAARQDADERHASELAAAAARLADVQAQYDAAVAEAARTRDVFEQQLSEAAAALEGARQERASETAAAADHLAGAKRSSAPRSQRP